MIKQFEKRFRLKVMLLEKFEKQYVAAQTLGVREDVLSRILTGRQGLSEDMLRKIEKALHAKREVFLSPL